MKNLELARLFDRTADVLAVKGENSFRILAYRKIARTLEELPDDIERLAKEGKLEEIPGIGSGSATRIQEYLRTGHVADLEELWSGIPGGVMDMMKVPSIGPKTAALLWREGGVESITALQEKLGQPEYGGLTKLAGLGAKKLEKIKQSIAFLSTSAGRQRLGEALPIAVEFVDFLLGLDGVLKAQYCGSLRRARETIGDVDIAVSAASGDAAKISTAIIKHPYTAEVLGAGETKTSIRTGNGLQIDVRIVPPASFGAAVQYFTGSKEHNVHLREICVKRGLKLNEWGLFKGEKQIAGKTEEEIYEKLEMVCLPPEMREDKGEIELAQELYKARSNRPAAANTKSEPAVWETLEIKDIRGSLHMHTVASDGTKSIEDMVAECKHRGFTYMAITDHSKSQFQAAGLRVDQLMAHIKAIHAVAREAKGILVLAGSEVDILADGSMDYEDDVLAKLDWVVGSPHAALSQESEPATQRLVRAIANPYVHLIGHPTGRLVPGRRGLEPDMSKVIFAAARSGVALELNANYHRLDLRDTHLRMARDARVPICINTDAHGFADFDQLQYGILTARRGWLRKENVLNARPLEGFKKWLKERKEQAGW